MKRSAPNDLPDSRTTGVLFVGAKDNVDCANLEITEQVVPLPNIHVRKVVLDACTMAVVEVTPSDSATIADLDLLAFQSEYLPAAIAPEVLEENGREVTDQLRALKLLGPGGAPTNAGILVLGRDPRNWLPGAYIQFVRYAGVEVTGSIRDQKEIDGSLSNLLRRLDEVLEVNVAQRTDLSGGS